MPPRSARTAAGRQLTVWLPGRLSDEVDEAAKLEGLTASAVARRAIIFDLRRRRSDDRDDDRRSA